MSRAIQPILLALATLGTAFYVARFWTVFAAGELFHRLGWDWTMFWAQAMLLRSGRAADMYEQPIVNVQLQVLAQYYTGPGKFQNSSPVAYPPWFTALVVPFTVPPPPIGFALWSAVSLLCAVVLIVRLRQILPSVPWLGLSVLMFGAFPVALGLFMGQVALIGALAVCETFISFRAGHDFRGGLWLSMLLLKPQYAIVFGLIILWKWRLRAMLGSALGSLFFVGLGLLTAGYTSFLRVSDALRDLSDLRSEDASPLLMVNWRAFVLYAVPWIDSDHGLLLVTVLSVATVVLLLYLWRGPWNANAPDFPIRFAALTLAAVATSYHSHVHGMALAIVPLAAAWPHSTLSVRARAAVLAAFYVPTLWLVWLGGVVQHFAVPSDADVSLWYPWPDGVPALLFMAAFALVCRDVWRLDALTTSTRRLQGLAPARRLRTPARSQT
jgi:Glycosyltransferase family 87